MLSSLVLPFFPPPSGRGERVCVIWMSSTEESCVMKIKGCLFYSVTSQKTIIIFQVKIKCSLGLGRQHSCGNIFVLQGQRHEFNPRTCNRKGRWGPLGRQRQQDLCEFSQHALHTELQNSQDHGRKLSARARGARHPSQHSGVRGRSRRTALLCS